MLRVLLFVAMFLCLVSSSAFASSCYSAKEAEAEQAIRIHSELMVIGLNCQHMTPRGWKNFYQQYREITQRHQSLLSNYEKTLIRSNGGSERKMHDMRTSFANKTSTDAAKMRPDVFCSTYAPRIPRVAQMSRAEFQQWAAAAAASQRLTKPICH